jgi:SOS response regulatory protein OraA/RecX
MHVEWRASREEGKVWVIYVDGEPWKEVYKGLFASRLKRLLGACDWADLEARFVQVENEVAVQAAVRLLAARSRLTGALRDRLKQKLLSDGAVAHAVRFCLQRGYLNDVETARSFVQAQLRRGRSVREILWKLRVRDGASPELVQQIYTSELKSGEFGKADATDLRQRSDAEAAQLE